MTLTYIGNFAGSGAYPTINRHLTAALERQGVSILRNVQNAGLELTPVAISCLYPPQVTNVKHPLTAISTNWEFPGAASIPRSFIKVFDQVDMILAHSAWAAEQFRLVTNTPVHATPLGFDPDEFAVNGASVDWNILFRDEAWANDPNTKFCLWVGGTDKRHGLDIACEVIKRLPETYHLIAKCSVDYPAPIVETHSRIHILRHDFPTLAPLYRACDVFLNTARAVGFSMPVLEALACGAVVVSTNCPPVKEYGLGVTFSERGHWERFNHHLHTDCLPQWWQPDIEHVASLVIWRNQQPKPCESELANWRSAWSWDSAAKRVMQVLGLEAKVVNA